MQESPLVATTGANKCHIHHYEEKKSIFIKQDPDGYCCTSQLMDRQVKKKKNTVNKKSEP